MDTSKITEAVQGALEDIRFEGVEAAREAAADFASEVQRSLATSRGTITSAVVEQTDTGARVHVEASNTGRVIVLRRADQIRRGTAS